jgi:hypothetical protein
MLLVTYARDWHTCFRDRVLRTCIAFGVAGFVGCFPRPDNVHIAFAAPLVCPLLAYCIRELTGHWPSKYRYALTAVAVAFLFPAAHLFERSARTALRGPIVPTARGGVWLAQFGAAQAAARIAATPSGDQYFFYPYDPLLAFLTGRRHAAKYDIFTPGYTLPSHYRDACISIMRNASWVVIDREWADPKFIAMSFPAIRDPEPVETRRFEQALELGFGFVARDGNFELRQRVPTASDAVCS